MGTLFLTFLIISLSLINIDKCRIRCCIIVTIVKAFVKSIYIAKKWISDITAPLYHVRRCDRNGFRTMWGCHRLGFGILKCRGFTYDCDPRYSVTSKLCTYLQCPLRAKFRVLIFVRKLLQMKTNVQPIVPPCKK